MGRWVLFGGVSEFSMTPVALLQIYIGGDEHQIWPIGCVELFALSFLLGNHPVDWNKSFEIKRLVSRRKERFKPGAFVFLAEEQQLVYDSSMKLYQQTAAVDDLLEPVVGASTASEPCTICGWANVDHGEHSE